ncbi:MAG: hypothetical protein JSV83_20950 [Desulfobacterales bacterium]|nr:MAG: hypothetical protein JSV83_20950 [Desulfobacterales bacterium]
MNSPQSGRPLVQQCLIKRVLLAGTLSLLMFIGMACTANTQDRSASSISVGIYNYIAKDNNGAVIAEGKLEITSVAANAINGKWELKTSAPMEQTGPQDGQGKIGGQLSRNKIILDLNPGWRDNNVVLSGTFQKGKLSGTWGWYGIAGAMQEGTFEAIFQEQ